MGIGPDCTDRNALIRQMEKSLRDVAVLLHDNDQDLVRFANSSIDIMTIAFYLPTFIGDALWSRSIRWNSQSFPIIHPMPSLLLIFLLGVRG